MKPAIHTTEFTIYRLPDEGPSYVAIPKEYSDVISKAISIYGSIGSVPSDKTVRGIFLHKENNRYCLDENAQQNAITINQLSVA